MYGYYPFGYFDPTYILLIIGAVLSMIASAKVKGTFNRYKNVRSMSNMTGAEAAGVLLNNAGIYDVSIEHIRGELSDHYDPRNKVLRLSDSTYASTSVAAIGVAAHECGHAIQHQEGYAPLKFRSALVPLANFGSKMGIPIILLGVLLSFNNTLIQVGIWVFALAVLFQLVTLPVEINASKRATLLVEKYGILGGQETQQCKQVLRAAAYTYVAAAAASVLSLLRLVLLYGRRGDND